MNSKYDVSVENFGTGTMVILNASGAATVLTPDSAISLAIEVLAAAKKAQAQADKKAPGWANRQAAGLAAAEMRVIADKISDIILHKETQNADR